MLTYILTIFYNVIAKMYVFIFSVSVFAWNVFGLIPVIYRLFNMLFVSVSIPFCYIVIT